LAKKLKRNQLVQEQTVPVSRTELWKKRGEYAFVLSPHGWGLDCHRTWEALTLGHIVLVPTSSLDSLYADLPVIPLKSWDEINPTNLENWISLHSTDATINPKLRSQYWINRMRSWDEKAADKT
jgi:hypothetical protein